MLINATLLVSSNKKVKIKIGSPEIDNTKEAFRCASCKWIVSWLSYTRDLQKSKS